MNGFTRFAGTALLASCAMTASAATFTVNNTNDAGTGSLREAILMANSNPGLDTIHFNIGSASRTLDLLTALPALSDSVTIDASTQPGFSGTPVVQLNGSAVPGSPDGFRVLASNCTIRALAINRFGGDGIEIVTNGNNVIEGCVIGLDLSATMRQSNRFSGIFITNSANNRIGGSNGAARNIISGNNQHGIHIGGVLATNNQILGNVIGLGADNSHQPNSLDGIRMNGPRNFVGGLAQGSANIISANGSDGIEIGPGAAATTIQGNFIGTDLAGTFERGNTGDGILVNNSSTNRIGGNRAEAGNVVSGNGGFGITLNGAAFNLVLGNRIGTDASGIGELGNTFNGILITGQARANTIGGPTAGEGNVIAFNGSDGVFVSSGTNNSIRGNSIFLNSSLGIDLGVNGVTPNDAGDSDTGPNQLQNFPVLTGATNLGTALVIAGSINSRPGIAFNLDFFANDACDPGGNGEGQVYLGSAIVTTDGGGNAAFSRTIPGSFSQQFVTATATDPLGDTSEFSACRAVVGTTSDLAVGMDDNTPDPVTAGQTLTYSVTVTNLGPQPAIGAGLLVELDSLVVVTSTGVSQGSCQQAGNSIICDVGTVTVGAVVTLTIQASPSDTGTLNSSASVTTSSTDPVSSNNSATAQTMVSPGRGVLMFESSSYHAMEGTSASIRIIRQGGAVGDVMVGFVSSDGTATAGQDYSVAQGQVMFTNGQTFQGFNVSTTADDVRECNEYLSLRLTNATGGAAILLRNAAVLNIAEHDPVYHSSVQPVSLTPAGARSDAYQPDVSDDGNYIAFFSYSDSLVPNDENFNADVFVYDHVTRANVLASVNVAGTGTGNGFSGAPSISGNGRYVAFQSDANDLVPDDNNNEQDIFVRDTVAGTTILVSRNVAGTGSGNGYSYDPIISSDGRYVAFVSYANDLTRNADANDGEDVFLRDIIAGATWLVSISSSGARAGNGASYSPRSIQTVADAVFILFVSDASDLSASTDMNDAADVFVRDIRGTTHLISLARTGNRSGNQASGEPYMFVNATGGVYVAFTSFASDLVPNDNNSASDVFLREVPLARTSLISENSIGAGSGNESSGRPSMSRDLRYIAFESRASDLAAGDGNNADDIFVRDVVAGTTVLVTRNCADTASADAYSYDATISADGRYVVFASAASDLVPGYFPNRSENVYRHDLVKRKTTLLSQNWDQTGGGTNHSYAAALSTNGSVVGFESLAPNLAAQDSNEQQDVFAWAALPPQTLGIKFANSRMRVQWSSDTAPEFSLQQATSFNPIVVWSPVTNAVADDGVSRAVTIPEPLSQRQSYYRLRKP